MIKAGLASIYPYVGDLGGTVDSVSEMAAPISVRACEAPHGPDASSADRLRREIRENYELVWRSLRRLGVATSSIEDAAQQVLVVFARRIDEIHHGAERAFLFATATRVAADFRKKQSRSREDADSETLDEHASVRPSVDELIDQGRAREILDWVLAEMPLDLRTVFILFEIEDMTMATISEMLDVPPGTVASRLRRARMLFESIAARLQRPRRER